MKTRLDFLPLLAICALSLPASSLRAGEVAFQTLATTHSQAHSSASEGAYFGIFGGANLAGSADAKTDHGTSFDTHSSTGGYAGVELGYAWKTPYVLEPAAEVEAFWVGNDYTVAASDHEASPGDAKLAFNSLVAMANFILNINLAPGDSLRESTVAGIKPFVGGGVGGAYVGTEKPHVASGRLKIGNESDFTFSWQLFGGVEVAMTDTFGIYAEYRYLVFDDVGTWASDASRHLVGAGFRFKFD